MQSKRNQKVEWDRGWEPGRIGMGGGQEARGDRAGYAGVMRGGRRMGDISFLRLFGPFLRKLSKIRTKECLLFTLHQNFGQYF